MQLRKYFLSFILAAIASWPAFSAVSDLPVVMINGKQYYEYVVKKGEGELSVAKHIGLPIAEIKKYNPEVSEGLKVDQRLHFPVSAFKSHIHQATGLYLAKKGDTVYGISKKFKMNPDEFLKLNPQAQHGIQPDETYKVFTAGTSAKNAPLTHNHETSKVEVNNINDARKYIIRTGETIYSIATSQGCTVEEIMRLNPGLDIMHYEVGQEILLPLQSTAPARKVVSKSYLVKPGDTFYGIARSHGLSIEQLQDANPGVNILKEGMALRIPDSCAEIAGLPDEMAVAQSVSVTQPIAVEDTVHEKTPIVGAGELPVISSHRQQASIGIILPFMASSKNRSKQAKAYGDFYRGFALAVDSLKHSGREVNLFVYDSEETPESLNAILSDSKLKSAQVIITSDNISSIETIARYADKTGAQVLNLFSTKDTTYVNHKSVLQANIPYDLMVKKALAQYLVTLERYQPVFIMQSGAKDKDEIIKSIESSLLALGKKPVKVHFTESLSVGNLKQLPKGTDLLFIPNTGRAAISTNILETLAKYKDEIGFESDIAVLGYPEWIALKGAALENMHSLNTSIYSRFSSDPNDASVKELEARYQSWYGHEMPAGVPRQTLSGFDTAMYLIKALTDGSGKLTDGDSTVYDGVQMPFHFVNSENLDGIRCAGSLNDAMYILKFYPGDIIEKIVL